MQNRRISNRRMSKGKNRDLRDITVSDLNREELLQLVKRICFRVTQRDLWLARYDYTSALGLRLMDESMIEMKEAKEKGSWSDYMKANAKFDRGCALCDRADRYHEKAMNYSYEKEVET